MEGEKKSPGCREEQLSLISWNIDGLDGDEQPERARSLCSYLTEYSADVVLLQEMVQPYMRFMHRRLGDEYAFIEGGQDGYFTMMLLKKSRLRLLDHHIVNFPKSRMMRNLLIAQVEFGGQKLSLMTSHFESCKANSAERMRQLRQLMKMMSRAPDDQTVLFGGDTNLRDHEVAAVGLPGNIVDLWEELGEPEKCRYTWDTRANTNKEIPFKCRFRFDRVYLRQAGVDGVPLLEPRSMALIGLEKLRCGMFTSDHWGIYATFSVTHT
ncbi:tyrosyl-DNA phosphodiesterase 2-like isoform X1 [Xiphophorus couchianus]|uniref:tyrosyl-DNA phosphodiesterase 2-like isoform X1 n=1 Tax=Xiphophorus couchianus TaxID=32473 RepID=UPI00101614C2|nr:tyrosyl-DNA phosphodiesterase 2-like isoform X1 [Xiphophorus couchianus]